MLELALAVGSGKFMQEDWLRDGQVHHLAYSLHLGAWLLIAAVVLWYLATVLRRGGISLAASMLQLKVRSNDTPLQWPAQLIRGFRCSV
jgi:hypothetical protein